MGAKVYTFLGFMKDKYIGASDEVYRTKEACQAAIDACPKEVAGVPVMYKMLEMELKDE